MRKLRPTKESDLPNITQSGSGERTFLLAFKRNHCSPGGLASVATDAALLRALNGGEARGTKNPLLLTTAEMRRSPVYYFKECVTHLFLG